MLLRKLTQRATCNIVATQGRNERAVSLAMVTVTRFYTAMVDHDVTSELPPSESAPL